jgi:hypothetical protein
VGGGIESMHLDRGSRIGVIVNIIKIKADEEPYFFHSPMCFIITKG